MDVSYDMSKYNLKKLLDDKYIVMSPKIEIPEHDQLKSFITLNFDTFWKFELWDDAKSIYRLHAL